MMAKIILQLVLVPLILLLFDEKKLHEIEILL